MCFEQHLPHLDGSPGPGTLIKWIETRGYSAPAKHIGRYIGIHSAVRPIRDGEMIGGYTTWRRSPHDWLDRSGRHQVTGGEIEMPRGYLIGTARLVATVPMVDGWTWQALRDDEQAILLFDPPHETVGYPTTAATWRQAQGVYRDIDDQIPYGLYQPGRHAWILADARPTSERCPACLNTEPSAGECPHCHGTHACEPVQTGGKQGWWYWTPNSETAA